MFSTEKSLSLVSLPVKGTSGVWACLNAFGEMKTIGVSEYIIGI